MTKISEAELVRIVDGIYDDREAIIRHNPIGPGDEVLLWMLLSCLISYLDLTDAETPCFPGAPSADTYRAAILFVVRDRMLEPFDAEAVLARLEGASTAVQQNAL